jgi:NAD(P)-dependent dehydrogenase (short-subunit alcohol dehydrogenase family)
MIHKLRSRFNPAWCTVTVLVSFAQLIFMISATAGTVMITGSNSGIGLEFAKQYADKGWTVIATHRRSEIPKSLAELIAQYGNRIRVETLDVTSLEQAQALQQKLQDVPIDVLLNNAGVYNDRSKCAPEDEGCPGDWTNQILGNQNFKLLDTIMAVNIKGPLIVTEVFYPNVKASQQKKLIAISSSNGTLTGEANPRPGAMYYRMSKAALNREFQIVAATARTDGVTVLMLNPGPTATEHQAYLLERYPDMMLKTSFTVGHMIDTIDRATIDDTGKFLRYDGEAEPW